MKAQFKTNKRHLECFVLCEAEAAASEAIRAARNFRRGFRESAIVGLCVARKLRVLHAWFPEDWQTILAAARRETARMRAQFAQWDAEQLSHRLNATTDNATTEVQHAA